MEFNKDYRRIPRDPKDTFWSRVKAFFQSMKR